MLNHAREVVHIVPARCRMVFSYGITYPLAAHAVRLVMPLYRIAFRSLNFSFFTSSAAALTELTPRDFDAAIYTS